MPVRHDALLAGATEVLLRQPTASLAEVAAALGVSRTTLYSRFPTRQALLVALAETALDLVEKALVEARLDDADVPGSLRRAVDLLIPLGPRAEFLLRERSLDGEPELVARYQSVDAPLEEFVARAQRAGRLRADLPAWWIVSSLFGGVGSAWEAIDDGRLAPRDATALVLGTLLSGVGT